jgi:hypothetical protein
MKNSCECGKESSGSVKCSESLNGYITGGRSSSAQLHKLVG